MAETHPDSTRPSNNPESRWSALAVPFWEALEAAQIPKPVLALLLSGLRDQWRADCYAKLRQADQEQDFVELSKVFVDLAGIESEDGELYREGPPAGGFGILKRLALEEWRNTEPLDCQTTAGRTPTVVLLGGPGQGKSTLGQFLFLIHAGIILRTARDPDLLDNADRERIDRVIEVLPQSGLELPVRLRLPIRLELSTLVGALSPAGTKEASPSALLGAVGQTWAIPMPSAEELRSCCRAVPWVLILDGLDEVPSEAGRAALRRALAGFGEELKGTDGVVLGSSRPQSYDRTFFSEGVEWQLLPFTVEGAKQYGYGLAEAWRGKEPLARQRLCARIDDVLQDPTTAAMMRTPLQVAIMALLVERKGKAPALRWTLFQEYYNIIHNREISRGGPFAELLRDYAPHLRQIHAHAALCLQTLAEEGEGSSAQLPAAALRTIIEQVLSRNGMPEEEASRVACDLLDAAEQRLVFLVRRQSDSFSFELRSIQEFFAAYALTTGRDEAVLARLRHLGPVDAWRNVYLFAVSRQFDGDTDVEVRRERVTGVCSWLDSESGDPLCSVTRSGARLATGILADANCGPHAAERAELMRLSLRLLDLAPCRQQVELALLLGSHCGEAGKSALRQGIATRLDSSGSASGEETLGAWVALFTAAAVEPESFGDLACKHWENLSDEDKVGLCGAATLARAPADWLLHRAWLEPSWLSYSQFVAFDRLRLKEELRGRLESDIEHFLPLRYLGNPLRIHRFALLLDDTVELVGSWPSIERGWGTLAATAATLREWNPTHPSWAAFRACLHFSEAPSAVSLATALRELARLPESALAFPVIDRLWPLATCVRGSADFPLETLAARVERGELGDWQDWLAIEDGWMAIEDYGIERLSLSREQLEAFARSSDPLRAILIDRTFPPLPRHVRNECLLPNRKTQGLELLAWTAKLASDASTSLGVQNASLLGMSTLSALADLDSRTSSQLSWQRMRGLFDGHVGRFPFDVLCAFTLNGVLWSDQSFDPVAEAVVRADALTFFVPPESPILEPVLARVLERIQKRPTSQNARFFAKVMGVLQCGDAQIPPQKLPDIPDADPEAKWLIRAFGGLEPSEIESWRADLVSATSEAALTRVFDVFELVGTPREPLERLTAALLSSQLCNVEVGSYLTTRAIQRLETRPSRLSDSTFWNQLALPQPHPSKLPKPPSPQDTVSSEESVSVITSLVIQNLRIHESLTIERSPEHQDQGQWFVLLGENGTGKTTLLRALAMALGSPGDAAAIPSHLAPGARLVRTGAAEGSCRITLADGKRFEARVSRSDDGEESIVSHPRENGRPWVVAYGCRRGSAFGSGNPDQASVVFANIANLFDNPPGLINADAWLKELQRKSLDKPDFYKAIYDSARKALGRLLLEVRDIVVELDDVWVTFNDDSRRPLAGLSDGYLTTAGWGADLMARWIERQIRKDRPIPENFPEQMCGFVLLDEIDLHLHPRWQERVILDVRKAFPRLSFVVTSHNPVTLFGAQPGEVFVLEEQEGTGGISAKSCDIPPGTRVGELLTGPWFNQKSELDFDTRDRLEKHQRMLLDQVPENDPERVKLEESLRRRLGRFMDDSLERTAARIAAEELKALSPRPTFEQKELARKKIRERLQAERQRTPRDGSERG